MKLILVLVVLASFALASDLTSDVEGIHGFYGGYMGTDDIIDSYALNAGELHTSGFANFHATGQTYPYITADDFVINVDAQIAEIVYWSTGSDPAAATVYLYEDAAPGPGTELQSVGSTIASAATTVPWGAGYVYEATLTLAAPITFDLGTNYWIAPLSDDMGAAWYTCVGTTVTGTDAYLYYNGAWGPWTAQGQPACDMFRILDGTTSSLQRTTWGSIKDLF